MKRLSGKTAIITGAGSGLGAADARLFAGEGASVLLTDVREEPVKVLAKELRAAGFDAEHAVHDVTSEEQWAAVATQAVESFGKIDILINNAGIANWGVTWSEANYADFQMIMRVNLDSQYLGIQAVRPHMERNGGGAIVNISSVAGFIAFAKAQPAYTASKDGSRLLTKSAALDLAGINVRVNSVHPGLIKTPMNDGIVERQDVLEGALAVIPMGRMGAPSEVARAVLFLASDEASYITGTELIIDGGLTVV